jgi:prepilin-type N-terminal cleavage/methylation domain-containing protein
MRGVLKKGFSIIELLIALAVVSIVASALMKLFLDVTVLEKDIEFRSVAYRFVDAKIETLRSSAFDSIATENGTVSGLPNSNYSIAVSDYIDGGHRDDIKLVTVTINWNYKQQKTVKSETYIAKSGIKK